MDTKGEGSPEEREEATKAAPLLGLLKSLLWVSFVAFFSLWRIFFKHI